MSTLCLLRRAQLHAPDPIGLCDILIAGDRVARIAPEVSQPPGDWPCEVIDLAGAAVIPGLIDCHVHLTGGGGEAGAHTRVPAPQVSALVQAGVTSAIGLLGTDGSTRSIAESLACARTLEHHGLRAHCYTGSYELPLVTLSGSVRGDLVHNDRLIAVGELALSDHRGSQPTLDELLRLASDCHVAGMLTGKAGLLHLHMGDGPRGLELVRRALQTSELPARTFHPTHCNRKRSLWQEAKALSAEFGCPIDVTTFEPDDDGLSAAEAVVDWLASGLDPSQLTVSSDGGGCLPTFDRDGVLLHMDVGSCAGLLATLTEVGTRGLAWTAALPMMTRNVAQLFRLPSLGNLAMGSLADLVVLDAALRPRWVRSGARWLMRDGEVLSRGLFERSPAA